MSRKDTTTISPIISKEEYEAAQRVLAQKQPPRGYKWQDGKLVIDEAEAAKVRAAFDAYTKDAPTVSRSIRREE